MSSLSNKTLQATTLAWATVLGESVSDLAWSTGSDILYAACVDGEFIAYDLEGESLFRQQTHNDAITKISVQPMGNLVATSGEDGIVCISNGMTGEVMETMIKERQWSEVLSWSPDGKALACAVGKKLFVRHDTNDMDTWNGHPGIVGALVWAPNGKRLASGTNKGVYLWNIGTWDPVKIMDFPGAAISLAWSHDGKALAVGTQDGFMHIRLHIAGQTPRQLTMSGYPGKVSCLDWSPQYYRNKLRIASCGGNDVVLWTIDLKTAERQAKPLRQHDRTVTALAWSYDGSLLISGDRGGRICLWTVYGDFEFDMELGTEVTSIAWHPTRLMIAVGNIDGTLRLFSLETESSSTHSLTITNTN